MVETIDSDNTDKIKEKIRDYVKANKESYEKEGLISSLKATNAPNKIIDQVIKEEYPSKGIDKKYLMMGIPGFVILMFIIMILPFGGGSSFYEIENDVFVFNTTIISENIEGYTMISSNAVSSPIETVYLLEFGNITVRLTQTKNDSEKIRLVKSYELPLVVSSSSDSIAILDDKFYLVSGNSLMWFSKNKKINLIEILYPTPIKEDLTLIEKNNLIRWVLNEFKYDSKTMGYLEDKYNEAKKG